MVRSFVAGRAYLWSLNENHPLVPAFRDLFDAERSALSRQKARLRRALLQAGGVRRAVIFGSAARGEERAGSDLDLLVVAENRKALKRIEKNLGKLRAEFWQDGGPRLSPLMYTVREFERKSGLPVIQAAEREGEVLVGEEGS
jgi:predicted nucleotidyltransferase